MDTEAETALTVQGDNTALCNKSVKASAIQRAQAGPVGVEHWPGALPICRKDSTATKNKTWRGRRHSGGQGNDGLVVG